MIMGQRWPLALHLALPLDLILNSDLAQLVVNSYAYTLYGFHSDNLRSKCVRVH